jgi:hypothetical protein
MRRRVPQPPVEASRRAPEPHDFSPGFILGLIAALLLFAGARHVTSVETTDGHAASELQLVKSFTCGGLKAMDSVSVPDPASYDDPAAAAAALERMARDEAKSSRVKYRVNTGAVDPCPT